MSIVPHLERNPIIRRMLAKAWRNGYNAACRDDDAVTEWCYGEPHHKHPAETRNPYGDI